PTRPHVPHTTCPSVSTPPLSLLKFFITNSCRTGASSPHAVEKLASAPIAKSRQLSFFRFDFVPVHFLIVQRSYYPTAPPLARPYPGFVNSYLPRASPPPSRTITISAQQP